METANLKTLMHDPDYYTKTFQVYAKRSAKYEVLAKWGDTTFPPLVVDRLAASFPAETAIKLLGVGSGSGEMDSKMAASIKSRFKSVHNTVLEPAAAQLELYRGLIERKKADLQGIEFDLRQDTMDGYREKLQGATQKYHFISAIHSLYYVDDLNDSIKYLYDSLEEGGVLMIICVSDVSGFWRLWDRFTRFQDTVSRYYCTRHLRDGFNANSIAFSDHRQESRVDITECFDPKSEDGNLVVDFLAHTVDLRGTAPPELYREVVDYLGSESCSERKPDGQILFNNDWDAVIAQKPCSN